MNADEKKPYQPFTLKSHNQYRRDYLPCFPTPFPSKSSSKEEEQPALLLSNVPKLLLSTQQLQCRQRDQYPCPFQYQLLGNSPSFLNFIYRYLYQHLSARLQIDEALIDFNLTRLDEAMSILAMNNDWQYWTEEQQRTKDQRNIVFDLSQWAIALEIFLQTDVDMLYMKTCSYRGAQPRSLNQGHSEGLFCVHPPEARTSFLPCTHEPCRCCWERRDLTGRPEPCVRFSPVHSYQFLNGYQVLLNCPATCTTMNVIYALKCVCHQFEYIGETKMAFSDRLWRHHQHGTRIMCEFFLGAGNEPKSAETLVKDRMRLYRHSTLCSTAIQMFLRCNPQYWCCVPMKESDAKQEDRLYAQKHQSLFDPPAEEMIFDRSDREIQTYIDHLPSPPRGCRFSQRQRDEQYLFFKNKRDLIPPSVHLDLYNATIIFVLPEDCADFVRHFVESLLITHTECKLNTAGHLPSTAMMDHHQYSLSNPLAHGLWFEKLVHPMFQLP